jgi:hypothetical protein|tara:strand:- start:41 stop:310 length:270 start_codon:yes stop_codon:yes gene_type:complete
MSITPVEILIDKLNKSFPGCNAVDTEEWNGNAGHIWFRGGEMPDGLDVINMYAPEPLYIMGVHGELDAFLAEHGWHGEPHDAGTLMAYR